MSQEQWTAVDRYITDLLVPPDPALDAALQASAAAGLPPIAVSPNQGKLLHLLARVQGASTILELGTLGGYSTIWLARALPAGGRLVTLEANPQYAEVARANIANAGLADVVELRVGPALDTLSQLASEDQGGAYGCRSGLFTGFLYVLVPPSFAQIVTRIVTRSEPIAPPTRGRDAVGARDGSG